MALEPWRTGKVIRIADETYNTKRFWIEVPELERFDFKAGQFVTLDLPIHEQRNKRWRSYSIASWPDGSNVFELLIVLLDGGLGTNYLFNEISVGSEIQFRGPQGVFVLPDTIEKDIFFICTGTGIAPFRSMLNDIYLNNVPYKNLYLLFGCRTQKDLLYYDEMRDLESKMPDFYYLPALSREEWDGEKGYVHNIYERICLKNKEVLEGMEQLRSSLFYLCGWKAMVDEAKERIKTLGYDKKDIHLELYG